MIKYLLDWKKPLLEGSSQVKQILHFANGLLVKGGDSFIKFFITHTKEAKILPHRASLFLQSLSFCA